LGGGGRLEGGEREEEEGLSTDYTDWQGFEEGKKREEEEF